MVSKKAASANAKKNSYIAKKAKRFVKKGIGFPLACALFLRNSILRDYFFLLHDIKKKEWEDPSIAELKEEIEERILPLVDRDYCILGGIRHSNTGDSWLTQGMLELLKKSNFRLKYSCSYENLDESKVDREDLIINPGGGNFGDLWGHEHSFREHIVERFPKNRIIIFPQSVFFEKRKKLERAVRIFSKHPDLTLFARDWASFKFLKENFKENTVLLAPDTGLYRTVKIRRRSGKIEKILLLRRTDKELKEEIDLSRIKNAEIKDWPAFEKKFFRRFELRNFVKIFLDYHQLFLLNYDLVISTRLHGFIISLLLGIPVILLDNSYGKNKHFFETWFKNKPGHFYADRQEEMIKIIRENFPEILK